MTNYREILRLQSLGYSQCSIASGAKASRNTVSEVLKKSRTAEHFMAARRRCDQCRT